MPYLYLVFLLSFFHSRFWCVCGGHGVEDFDEFQRVVEARSGLVLDADVLRAHVNVHGSPAATMAAIMVHPLETSCPRACHLAGYRRPGVPNSEASQLHAYMHLHAIFTGLPVGCVTR